MTKKQAEQIFKEEYADYLKTATRTDKRCAWCDFTDYLCKDGHITQHQYNTWVHPRFLK